MELEVLNLRGIPQSGLLSISAGGTRKQVQLSQLDRPLRFPGNAEDFSSVKVDVLDVLGRGRLPYQANDQMYTVPLDSATGGQAESMEVDIRMRPCEGDLLMSLTKEEEEAVGLKRQMREDEANSYLQEHDLVSFMQFLLHGVMQDKPANPYPWLHKQIGMRMNLKSGNQSPSQTSPTTSPTGGPPAVPNLTGAKGPFLRMPTLQETEMGVTTLLDRVSPSAATGAGPEEIARLEQEAAEAVKRLLEDNAKLRDTAMQMNLEYQKLMQESADLHSKLDAKRTQKKEKRTQECYMEIERLQDEVNQLARENAKLVADLSRGREMINLVKQDMLEIRRCVGE